MVGTFVSTVSYTIVVVGAENIECDIVNRANTFKDKKLRF
jgi:hypothetical protein